MMESDGRAYRCCTVIEKLCTRICVYIHELLPVWECILEVRSQEAPLVRPVKVRWFHSIVAVAFTATFFALPMRGQMQSSTLPAAPGAAKLVPNGPQPQNTTGVATIRAYSDLVVVDVVVEDSKQNPIHGLEKSDFSLTENGKPQTIRSFEEHSALPASETEKVGPEPVLPPGLFTNKSAAPANGPVNVLLLDYLNTPLSVQPYARKQLIDYLDKEPAGTRIAIFGLTEQLDMLQGFTADPAVLKAALTAKKGTPRVSNMLSEPVGGGPVGGNSFSDAFGPAGGSITQEMVDDMNRVDAQLTSEQQDIRAKYTLNALDMLARYLVGIPGRKNVIWFSGSFPLDVEPDVNEADPNDSVIRNDDEVRKTDNLLTRAQVAVYPVDARGVFTDPTQSVTANSTITSGADAANEQMAFMTQTAQEHETMFEMASDTGGHAFVNTNNLTEAVSKAIQNGSNYYTITYSPTNTQWDERFRTIKIKVNDPSAKQVTYRNGYYAVDPNNRNKVDAQSAATALAQPNTMATAMMHGGPNPAEILFKVRIRPANTPPEETVLKSNQSNPNLKINGPYKSYGVDLVPDPHSVNCVEGTDGNRHCVLEVWTFVYDGNGDKLITASNRIRRLLTPSEYARLLSGGIAFHQEISVPVRGQYYLRTAIHDMVSDKVGAVEIPIAQVARLDPLAPPPAVPAAAPTNPSATETPTAPAPTLVPLTPPVIAPDGARATP